LSEEFLLNENVMLLKISDSIEGSPCGRAVDADVSDRSHESALKISGS
jgi:hypothetical protein